MESISLLLVQIREKYSVETAKEPNEYLKATKKLETNRKNLNKFSKIVHKSNQLFCSQLSSSLIF